MRTIHEQVARRGLIDVMEDERWSKLVASWARKLEQGQASQSDFAIYGQTDPRAGKWPMDQLAAAVRVHTFVMSGAYLWKTIFVERGPHADRQRDLNRAILASVPDPYLVNVWDQNLADQDGTLRWSAPVEVNRSTGLGIYDGKHDDDGVVVMPRVIDPGVVPLEIGTTMPSRTLLHMLQDGGVARWPYHCDYISLLINPSPTYLVD